MTARLGQHVKEIEWFLRTAYGPPSFDFDLPVDDPLVDPAYND